jgi:hypothetical protein
MCIYCTRARARARTHTHTHTHTCVQSILQVLFREADWAALVRAPGLCQPGAGGAPEAIGAEGFAALVRGAVRRHLVFTASGWADGMQVLFASVCLSLLPLSICRAVRDAFGLACREVVFICLLVTS